MDAGRLQGLAVPPSCKWSTCLHPEQLQLIPFNGLPKLQAGLALHQAKGHGAYSKGKSLVVRSVTTHEMATAAVAAAAVLPVCWIFMNRSQFSSITSSAPSPSSLVAAGKAKESVESVSTSVTSRLPVEDPGSCSVTRHSSGAAYGASLAVEESDTLCTTRHSNRVPNGAFNGVANGNVNGMIFSGEGRTSLGVASSSAITWPEQIVQSSLVAEEAKTTINGANSPEEYRSSLGVTSSSAIIWPEQSLKDTVRRSLAAEEAKGIVNGAFSSDECRTSLGAVPSSAIIWPEEIVQDTVGSSLVAGEAKGIVNGAISSDAGRTSMVVDSSPAISWSEQNVNETFQTSQLSDSAVPSNLERRRDSGSASISLRVNQTKKFPKGKVNRNKSSLTKSLSEILPLNESSDPDSCLRFYDTFLRSGRLQDCLVLLEEMNKVKILNTDKIYHSNFFKACQKQKAVKEAFRFTRLLKTSTLSTYNMLISVCREAGDVDGGLRALSAAENAGFKADSILYTTLISTCAKAGRVDVAFKVYHEMEIAGIAANIQTYGAMIDGCARAGQIAKAFGVYGIMMSKKIKPDLVIFNTLINACGRAGAIERAFDVLADMKAEPCFLQPNHVTFGALISACAQAGQVERAFEVYRSMRENVSKGTPECYTAAVHACSHTGDVALARSVLQDMKTDGVEPDEVFFSALIDVAGHAQEIDVAFNILDEMKNLSIVPASVTYSALMGVCCNTGNWERGLKVYDELKAERLVPTVSTYNALMTALCDAKQMEQAYSVLEEMKKRGKKPDQITYSILLDACESLDEPEKAFELYNSARAEGVVTNQAMCDSVIAICYSRIKKHDHSLDIPFPIGLVSGQREGPYEQWTSWALAVYRHTVGASVVPTIKSLSLLLGCLRIPEVPREHDFYHEIGYSHSITSTPCPSSIFDGPGLYDPRALALFENACSMGVVPHFNFTAGPITLNAETMPRYVAEVCLLTLLKGLKHRHAAGAQLFPVTILFSTEVKQTLTATREVKEITVSSRSGQAMTALLRRLKVHYQGYESSGKLRVAVASIRKWLKSTIPEPSVPTKPRPEDAGHAVPRNRFLARGIAEQQRAIRMGEVQNTSEDIDFRRTKLKSSSPLRYKTLTKL